MADARLSALPLSRAVDTGFEFYSINDTGTGGFESYRSKGRQILDFASSYMLPRNVNTVVAHENLICKYVTAATVDIDADAVVLFDTGTGTAKRFTGINETLTITDTGQNGRGDTGTEAASMWYHLWGLGKWDGTFDAFFFESATSPSRMHAGYDFKGYLGAARNNGSSNLVGFLQRGRSVIYAAAARVFDNVSATSYTSVSLDVDDGVPPSAKVLHGDAFVYLSTGSGTESAMFLAPFVSGGTATYGERLIDNNNASTVAFTAPENMPLDSQTINYKMVGTNARGGFHVRGWEY